MYSSLLRKWWQPRHFRLMKSTKQSTRNVFQGVVRRWQEEAEQHFPFFSWLLSLIDAYIVTCFQKQVIVKASGNKFKYSNAVLPEKKKKKKKCGLKGSLPFISILVLYTQLQVSTSRVPVSLHRALFLGCGCSETWAGPRSNYAEVDQRVSFDVCKNRSLIP